ncbi:MAG: carbonic anhydrase [Nitrospirae bacterium]|nr:carbonic anhydrase [Nitrospirota bacterium]
MDKLYKGIHKFQESYFKKEEEFFQRISQEQKPDVLFITCSDSRVDPNLVTQSKPGELFIVRNVGNIIPPYEAIKDKNSVAAAIEFAVLRLNVRDVIVCGHSNCGAMQSLSWQDSDFNNMPHLREWISIAMPVNRIMRRFYPDASADIYNRIVEETNVLLQLQNVQTYPFVADALNQGHLHLHGWYYDIGTGSVYSYDPSVHQFNLISGW